MLGLKVLPKRPIEIVFDVPKSSFGMRSKRRFGKAEQQTVQSQFILTKRRHGMFKNSRAGVRISIPPLHPTRLTVHMHDFVMFREKDLK
jgi:hypothetical protein